jgi:hypothetical protein
MGHNAYPHSYHLHVIETPDLTGPQEALDHARGVRERFGGCRHPGDLERRAAVEEALRSLQESWTSEHTAYMRRGQQIGRRGSDDPVRVCRDEMRAEASRLRAMLTRTSGTPRQAPPRVNAVAMGGHIARGVQVVRQIAARFEEDRSLHGRGSLTSTRSGGMFRSMRELNASARELLDELREERARVNVAWRRYELSSPPMTYAEQDAYDALWDRLKLLREEASALTADLVAASKQGKPDSPPKNGPWTFEKINAVIRAYESQHGRRPTKAEFNSDPTLPFYTEVRRKLGPNPLRTLDV